MNILLVENDQSIVLDISEKLNNIGYTNIHSTDTVQGALDYLTETKPIVVLIDIDLNGPLDGIHLGEILSRKIIPFIYLSKLQDPHTLERAIKTSPSANIPKPIGQIQLRNAIYLAVSTSKENKRENYIVVPSGSKKIKINPEHILYLKAASNNCEIHLFDGEKVRHVSSTPFGNVLKKIGMNDFCQVHRSYAVNMNHVHSFEATRLFIDGNPKIEIPISNSFMADFKGRFHSV